MSNIVAIVGRPNVGKSTLFNRLTESRQLLQMNKQGLPETDIMENQNGEVKSFL